MPLTCDHGELISPFQFSSPSLRANTTKQGCPLNYHLGELLHLGQRTQDISVKIHGFLPGSVCHRDEAPTAGPPTLLLAFIRSAAGATTLRLGTRSPWRRPAGLQQVGEQAPTFRGGVCGSAQLCRAWVAPESV